MTITTVIPTMPPFPSRGSDPDNFINEADIWVAAMPDFGEAMNAMATEMNATAAAVNADASTASAAAASASGSAISANNSATAAATYAGAAPWVAGSYATDAVAYSPLAKLPYRRLAPGGASPTDPALDPTNWTLATLLAPPYQTTTDAVVTVKVGYEYGLRRAGAQELDLPLPANLSKGDVFWWAVENGRRDNYLKLNGAKVNGEVQDEDKLLIDNEYSREMARWSGDTAYGWII